MTTWKSKFYKLQYQIETPIANVLLKLATHLNRFDKNDWRYANPAEVMARLPEGWIDWELVPEKLKAMRGEVGVGAEWWCKEAIKSVPMGWVKDAAKECVDDERK